MLRGIWSKVKSLGKRHDSFDTESLPASPQSEIFTDPATMELLTTLLGEWDPNIEDEVHVLRSCPRYNSIRQKLTTKRTAELLERDILIASMFSAECGSKVRETGIFIKKLIE
ncbi:hypothetical protein ACHWQZ_G015189 [Mnemiopsis leidyi]